MTGSKTLFFGGNWKAAMPPAKTKGFLGPFLSALKERRVKLEGAGAQIVIAPPSASLTVARAAIDHETWARKLPVALAVQDPWFKSGAYTGATTLADALDPAIGVTFAIIGHSETREAVRLLINAVTAMVGQMNTDESVRGNVLPLKAMGVALDYLSSKSLLALSITNAAGINTDKPASLRLAFDAVVNRMVIEALKVNVTPILCIGETLAERNAGLTSEVVLGQLRAGLLGLPAEQSARVVVAYEPVWAIGTGQTATPEQAQDVHATIAADLRAAGIENPTILYGGSMTADNVASLVTQPDVGGGLIDGASLDPAKFIALIDNALAAVGA